MADEIYELFSQAMLAGTYDLASATVKLALVRTGAGHYVPNFTTDQFLNVIAGGDLIATSAALSSKTLTDGVFNAANTLFTAVSGAQAGALVLYIDTGSSATSPLIAYLDTYSGLPYTPTGADVNVAFTGTGIMVLSS